VPLAPLTLPALTAILRPCLFRLRLFRNGDAVAGDAGIFLALDSAARPVIGTAAYIVDYGDSVFFFALFRFVKRQELYKQTDCRELMVGFHIVAERYFLQFFEYAHGDFVFVDVQIHGVFPFVCAFLFYSKSFFRRVVPTFVAWAT
jgi:hypothetical protein